VLKQVWIPLHTSSFHAGGAIPNLLQVVDQFNEIKHWLRPKTLFTGLIGTAEVMPCYRTRSAKICQALYGPERPAAKAVPRIERLFSNLNAAAASD
jgi:hypothetical protein